VSLIKFEEYPGRTSPCYEFLILKEENSRCLIDFNFLNLDLFSWKNIVMLSTSVKKKH